jgi:carboxylesterase type B
MPFINSSEAAVVYKKATILLNCWDSLSDYQDMNCLRSKTSDEILEATMGVPALLNNVFVDVIAAGGLTQLAEPYGPVVDGKFLTKHPYYLMQEGSYKPNSKITIEYGHDEGEEFIEEIFYPGMESRINSKLLHENLIAEIIKLDPQFITGIYSHENKNCLYKLFHTNLWCLNNYGDSVFLYFRNTKIRK